MSSLAGVSVAPRATRNIAAGIWLGLVAAMIVAGVVYAYSDFSVRDYLGAGGYARTQVKAKLNDASGVIFRAVERGLGGTCGEVGIPDAATQAVRFERFLVTTGGEVYFDRADNRQISAKVASCWNTGRR